MQERTNAELQRKRTPARILSPQHSAASIAAAALNADQALFPSLPTHAAHHHDVALRVRA